MSDAVSMRSEYDSLRLAYDAIVRQRATIIEALRDAEKRLVDSGNPPPSDLEGALRAYHERFLWIRSRTAKLIRALDLGIPKEPWTLEDIGRLLDLACRYLCRPVDIVEAIDILTAIRGLSHHKDDDFEPLAQCKSRAKELQDDLIASYGGRKEITRKSFHAVLAPFQAVIQLVDCPRGLTETSYLELHELVSCEFGPRLSAALSRGWIGRRRRRRLIGVESAVGKEEPAATAVKVIENEGVAISEDDDADIEEEIEEIDPLLRDDFDIEDAPPLKPVVPFHDEEEETGVSSGDVAETRNEILRAYDGPLPEIVCRKDGSYWVIAVEVPAELTEKDEFRIDQDEIQLPRHHAWPRQWCLREITRSARISWEHGRCEIPLHDDHCLLFKLYDTDRGRLVRYPTSGHYLAAVPPEWVRDEEISAPAHREPEPVRFPRCTAHFFAFDRARGALSFHAPAGQSIHIDVRPSRFFLEGKERSDGEVSVCPTFVDRLPRIGARDASDWDEIAEIVVTGEDENETARTMLTPHRGWKIQSFPGEIAMWDVDRFVVVLFDRFRHVLEVLGFRLAREKQIRLPVGPVVIPAPTTPPEVAEPTPPNNPPEGFPIDESGSGVGTTPVRPPPIEKPALIAGPTMAPVPVLPDVIRKKSPRGPRHISPKDRGGRRRLPDEEVPTSTSQPVAEGIPQLDVVCRLDGRTWTVMVELPKSLLDRPDLRVTQDGADLKPARRESDCWLLSNATAGIVVSWTHDGEADETVTLLDKDECLLFRLVGPDTGRLVDYPKKGPYLAIVPDGWERDEERSGVEPVDPEESSLDGFSAHYFDIDDTCPVVAFRAGGDRPSIERRRSEFHLVGNRIEDACERIGPLFGRDLPSISANGMGGWREISQIVVIEEIDRWRMSFAPRTEGRDLALPPILVLQGTGWFSLRLYDADDVLVESLDFRFVSAIEKALPDAIEFPSREIGYVDSEVELLHTPSFVIEASNDGGRIESVDDTHTLLTIPPDPRLNRTEWRIGTKDSARRVPFALVVGRVWWELGEEDTEPAEWRAAPLCLAREMFSPSSRAALWIHLPERRWANEINAGFRFNTSRRYRIGVVAESVAVPLREFSDARALSEPGDQQLDISLRRMGREWASTAGILKIACNCRKCGYMSANRGETRAHLAKEHLAEAFRPLTYNEMRKYVPELPSEIYKCTVEGCPDYVISDGLNSRTTLMAEHCREKHNRGLEGFRIVTDVDEIRELVEHALPHIYRCLLCRNEVVDIDEPDGSSARRAAHFTGHMQELIEIR